MDEAPAKRGSIARVHVVRRLRAALAPPTLRPGQRSLSGLPARHAGANTGSDLGSNAYPDDSADDSADGRADDSAERGAAHGGGRSLR